MCDSTSKKPVNTVRLPRRPSASRLRVGSALKKLRKSLTVKDLYAISMPNITKAQMEKVTVTTSVTMALLNTALALSPCTSSQVELTSLGNERLKRILGSKLIGDAEAVVVHCIMPVEAPEEDELAAGGNEPEVIGRKEEDGSEGSGAG